MRSFLIIYGIHTSFTNPFHIYIGVKYLIGLVPAILTGKIVKKPSLFWKLGGRDTVSFTVFLSSFITIYKTVLCTARYIRQTSDPLNSFIAGLFAGGSLFFDKNRSRRLMIALYLSTRTGHFICRWLWRHYIEKPKAEEKNRRLIALSNPNVTSSLAEKDQDEESIQDKQEKIIQDSLISHQWYQDLKSSMRQCTSVVLMSVSCSQIIYSFVCEPEALASSYRSFLITHCGLRKSHPTQERDFVRVLGETVKSSEYGTTKYLNSSSTLTECLDPCLPIEHISTFVEKKTPLHEFVLCQLQHPNDPTCTMNFLKFTMDAFQRALYLYVPLNIVMSLVYKGKKVIQEPLLLLKRIISSSIRSSIFLMTCSASAWALPCLLRRWYGTDKPWMYIFHFFLNFNLFF